MDKLAVAVKGQKFEIIQTNLSNEQKDKLRAAFAENEPAVPADETTAAAS